MKVFRFIRFLTCFKGAERNWTFLENHSLHNLLKILQKIERAYRTRNSTSTYQEAVCQVNYSAINYRASCFIHLRLNMILKISFQVLHDVHRRWFGQFLPYWYWFNMQTFISETSNRVFPSAINKNRIYHTIFGRKIWTSIRSSDLVIHRRFELRTPWLKVKCSAYWANESYTYKPNIWSSFHSFELLIEFW